MIEPAKPNIDTPAGVAYGLGAYIWWGVIPPYVALMKVVPALEILAHRIVLATLFLLIYLAAIGRFRDVGECLRDRKRRRLLLLSGSIVGVNWFIFILSVTTGHAKEGSLGYFISPLFNVLMGALIFHERLRPWQLLAIGIAAVAVMILVIQTGVIPWIALGLALTWSVYSAIRRVTPVDGVLGLTIESIFLSPLAAGYLAYLAMNNALQFVSHGVGIALLVASTGIAMTIPMVLFGQAARKLRLTTLGFLQYISPTIQFVLAVTIMGEKFHSNELPGYLLVWIALGIYIIDTFRALHQSRRASTPVSIAV